jgi:uncharacterized protein YgbK (DUF1537 family)
LIESFRQRAQRIEERLRQAKAKNLKKQIDALEKQKEQLYQQARNVAKRDGLGDTLKEIMASANRGDSPPPAGQERREQQVAKASGSSSPITEEQALWVAEQAYLRTLSRQPNANELSTATSYLKSEETPVKAIEGLMWSLINTKEFILNH